MHKSKLLKLFYQLDRKQKLGIRKFVHSPYHNHREDVQMLWDYIEKYAKRREMLYKEKAFEHLFPNTAYDDSSMRYVMSFLLQMIEQYLVVDQLDFREPENKLRLVRAYRGFDLPQVQERLLEDVREDLDKQRLRNSQFLYQTYLLELETYRHSEQSQRTQAKNLQALGLDLDLFYMAEKLKISCIQFSHESVYKTAYDYGLLPQILGYLEAHPQHRQHLAIGIYYHCYRALTQNNQEDYQAFLDLLLANRQCFEREEQADLFVLAINYGIRAINQGSEGHLQSTLHLYKKGLEEKILLHNGELSRFSFKNMIAIGLKVGDFVWVEQAIEEYQQYVNYEHRALYVHYASAKLAFAKKDYERASVLLRSLEYDELFMNIDAKIMLMKIYYETKAWDLLEYFLVSFRMFVNRKRADLADHQENYLNIMALTQQLTRLNRQDKGAVKAFREKIEQTEPLSEKAWLLSQLGQD
jgi:hypothetical protein